jgi:hypothetical protein
MRETIKPKVAKINQIVELVREHRVISATVLAKKVYGSATRENMLKLQRLITVCRKQGDVRQERAGVREVRL